jgi:hypothetical protein
VVSKPQIRFKGKASRELKTERTRKYVSISICGATQPLGLRWGFGTTSRQNACIQRDKTILLIKILREHLEAAATRRRPQMFSYNLYQQNGFITLFAHILSILALC